MPAVILVDPVHAIVEEIVGFHAGSVVDRIAGHRNQLREKRQIDSDVHAGQSDTDADISLGLGNRPQQQHQSQQSVEYVVHVFLRL